MKLKRSIGFVGILFTAIGSMIGSGWLFGPFYAAKLAGPLAIIAWCIGGILMMFIAMTFAELASTMPISGGTARYAHFSHGTLVSFTMSWCGWLASIVVAPIETMALLQYLSNYLPWLVHDLGSTHILSSIGIVIAAVIMLFMCFLNYLGILWVTKTNNTIVFFKIAVPLLTAVTLLFLKFQPTNFSSQSIGLQEIKGMFSALPAAGIVFSLIGYNSAVQLAGETKNPQKMIPLAIIGSVSICTLLYAFVQVAFLGAVDLNSALGWEGLNFAMDNGPFAGLIAALGLTWLLVILYVDAILSPFGTALIFTSTAARFNTAMSQNGYMPQIMQKTTKKGVPFNAIILNYLIGLFLFLPFPGWQSMVEFLVSAFIISFAVGPIALVVLREKVPHIKRPFKVPFVSVFCLIAFYVCNLLAFWTGWEVIWRLLAAIGIGYILLFIYQKVPKTNVTHLFFHNAWWLIPYFLGLGTLSLLGSFKGGLNIMPFGWDFLFIALFTIIIFYLAKKISLEDKHITEMLSGVIEISHEESDTFSQSLKK